MHGRSLGLLIIQAFRYPHLNNSLSVNTNARSLIIERRNHPGRKVDIDALDFPVGELGMIEIEVLAHVLARIEAIQQCVSAVARCAHNSPSPFR